MGGKLYAFGGVNRDGLTCSSVERYDSSMNQWETIAPMTVPRRSYAVAVLDGKIYVAGGENDFETFSSVERFDPVANAWEEVGGMRLARSCCSAALFNGSLYVAG